jgi:hypothetical protein
MQRRRFKHVLSFPDDAAEHAERLRGEAEKLSPGPERRALERKARQAQTAALKSPGLQPRNDEGKVRSVAEYQDKAAEFEALAASTSVDVLRKRYADIAACYRLLAKERELLISTGAIEAEQAPLDH